MIATVDKFTDYLMTLITKTHLLITDLRADDVEWNSKNVGPEDINAE